jgi:hypothetical protein
MQDRPTVQLIASDSALYRRTAATLAGADYTIVGPHTDERPPSDLILRHWEEGRSGPPGGVVPELALDLSLISESALLHVVGRALGRPVPIDAPPLD